MNGKTTLPRQDGFTWPDVTWIAVLAALIAVGGRLNLPLEPVPFSLQTFFVLLAGFTLGSARGALATMVYLVAGQLGLPIFAGGASGIEVLLGPTGGYLLSFPAMAALAGVATRHPGRPASWLRALAWGALASAVTFAFGVPWLVMHTHFPWGEALVLGFWPFLPGAAIKLVWSVATFQALQYLNWLPPCRRIVRPWSADQA